MYYSGMLKNILKFSSVLIIIIIVAGSALYAIKHLSPAPKTAEEPKPDEVVITDLPNGEKLVDNKTQGYSVKVPGDLFIQKSNGITLYRNTESNNCKIESTILINQDIDKNIEEARKVTNELETLKKFEIKDINIKGKAGKEITQETLENGLIKFAYINNGSKTLNVSVFPDNTNTEKCFNLFSEFLSNAEF